MIKKEIKTTKRLVGATMVEYAFMIALISILALVALNSLGGATRDTFLNAGTHLSG